MNRIAIFPAPTFSALVAVFVLASNSTGSLGQSVDGPAVDGPAIEEAATPAAEVAASQPDASPSYALELTPEAQAIAERFTIELEPGTEARAMFDAIMKGDRLRPNIGWFALAKSQTRYSWEETLERFDRNGDQAVEPAEFAADERLFQSVDRDADEVITAADFDWEGADPQQKADEKQKADEQSAAKRKTNLSRDVLIKALDRQEIGSLQPGPHVGEVAKDFQLSTYDGSDEVRLSEVIGEKPVVLVFGNFTCGPFRRQSEGVKDLYDRYGDRAEFLMVYVREAHPIDGWHMEQGDPRYEIAQPETAEERHAVAATCKAEIEFEMPFLVDGIDDQVGRYYSGMPSRLYLIDGAGKVAFKSGRGPHGFRPDQLEQALALHLAMDDQSSSE